jgi:hypothetical protein
MKKMFLYSVLAFICFTFSFCKDSEKDDLQPTGINVMQSVNVLVKSDTGIDLLDPANVNGIKEFKVYYLVNGAKELYSHPNLDAANGYRLLKHPTLGYYYLQILMDGGKDILETTTYLQLGASTRLDTIKTQYKSDPNNIIAENIWYNGSLVWTLTDGEPTFEIIEP